MRFALGLILILTVSLTVFQCANPGVVSGGPKDTIPPVLLYSYPANETLNFDDQTISLEFNERITAEKIKQSLIISPITEVKFKHFVKKNKITINFEEPFQDTTTYTFNFFNAITDITEKNPPLNLILAFSTGDFIDSLKVFGTVHDLLSDKPENQTTVALFRYTDTLDIFEETPTYFSTTDQYGIFGINNIKYGIYKLVAFDDENNNLNFDEDEELYSFLPGTINPSSIIDSIRLNSYQIDASDLSLNSSRISGRYYEMRYSKQIQEFKILDIDTILTVNANTTPDKEIIRFYNPYNAFPNDSIRVIVFARDSLKNNRIDTTYISFRESSRAKGEFTIAATPSPNTEIQVAQDISLSFSKPVKTYDLSAIEIVVDTIHSYQPDSVTIKWNHNFTQATLTSIVDKDQLLDSITVWQEMIVIDSLNPDTLSVIKKELLNKYDKNKIAIRFDSPAFISVEDDTASVLDLRYSFFSTEDRGTLTVNVESDSLSYFVQMLQAPQNKVVQEKYNCKTCHFLNISPGKYTLRFLIDENKDSLWSVGNIREDLPPERVIHFQSETEIRSNFDMELDVSL